MNVTAREALLSKDSVKYFKSHEPIGCRDYFTANLFKNKDILPTFDLITIEAVQSLGGDNNGFENWFDALEFMKNQINKVEFDICLIWCGAYDFLLASHVKNIGKKAVHWGGALQLLFGIKGKRWEDPNYASSLRNLNKNINYLSLMNDNWIRPESKRTEHSQSVENGCYW